MSDSLRLQLDRIAAAFRGMAIAPTSERSLNSWVAGRLTDARLPYGAKAGQLCRGAHGLTLSHHCDRASAYMALRRTGKVPWGKRNIHQRIKALEARVAALEALTQQSPRPRASRKVVR